MASKITRTHLVALLAAMLAVHAIVLKREWQPIPQGSADFTNFYAAGKIVAEGRGSKLYDYDLQQSVQRSAIGRGRTEQRAILPYMHPPFHAVLFAPLSRLPYLPAYFVWLAVNIGILVAVGVVLRRHLPLLRATPLWLWVLACLAFSPIFISLMLGQDSILLLLCYGLAWVALLKKSDFSAGAWLGVGLCKYQLMLPFMVAFVLQKRTKVIAGFAAVALILALISLAAVGWRGILSYPRFLLGSERSTGLRLSTEQPNLHGFLVTTLGNSRRVQLVVLAASVVLLAIAWYGWRSAASWEMLPAELAFAANLLMTLLVSYHAYVQDLSLLFLVLLLALDVITARPALTTRTRRVLILCLAILFFSPIYLVLILRFRNLQVLTPVLLMFFLGLIGAIASLCRTRSSTPDVLTPAVS